MMVAAFALPIPKFMILRPSEFIEEVMASFAKHAPKDCHLFFKNHPLDNGMIDYRGIIARSAAQHGIEDRIGFAAGGDLALLLDVARYKYPPVWVPLADLAKAMVAGDADNAGGAPRGVLVLEAN